jgi:hypothetical protein
MEGDGEGERDREPQHILRKALDGHGERDKESLARQKERKLEAHRAPI